MARQDGSFPEGVASVIDVGRLKFGGGRTVACVRRSRCVYMVTLYTAVALTFASGTPRSSRAVGPPQETEEISPNVLRGTCGARTVWNKDAKRLVRERERELYSVLGIARFVCRADTYKDSESQLACSQQPRPWGSLSPVLLSHGADSLCFIPDALDTAQRQRRQGPGTLRFLPSSPYVAQCPRSLSIICERR